MSETTARKPALLYHGSTRRIDGPLRPVLEKSTPDHVHERPAVFATERADIAALFMVPSAALSSLGFENGTAYICIWGTPGEFAEYDHGGWLYVLPADPFEKIGKEYEWQSFAAVAPLEARRFGSALDGMMECGSQVYFINDDAIFDHIRDHKDDRLTVLRRHTSENRKRGVNAKDI